MTKAIGIGLFVLAFLATLVLAGTGTGLNIHPMDQFVIQPLFTDGQVGMFTVTNATLWMALAVLATVALLVIGTGGRAVIPSRAQSLAELAYGFVYKMVEDVTGRDGVKYFPYIMTLFMFIVMANSLALLPMSFAPTSHIAVTAVLAMFVFLGVTILGFVKNGASFLSRWPMRWCMADPSRHPQTSEPPVSGPWRSADSCDRCAIRICPRPCCPPICAIETMVG